MSPRWGVCDGDCDLVALLCEVSLRVGRMRSSPVLSIAVMPPPSEEGVRLVVLILLGGQQC
eukprot:6481423-Amphidinium_carterae.1